MLLQEVQGEVCQPLLLGEIYRFSRSGGFACFCRAHFDEDDAAAVQSDQIKFAVGTSVVASQDAVAETLEEPSGGAFASRAEPAPPPRAAGLRDIGHGRIILVKIRKVNGQTAKR
jgi:hypothetical protein